MSGPAEAVRKAYALVEEALPQIDVGNDPDRAAYLIARAALVHINAKSGGRRASALAYQLADEFATEGRR